mmetsp:Transcript_24739/g.33445  ORF Transcript_24739/g.33445 Transcript_24739/m.33445 type:complete len:179 (+) Transcript_24739:55-591(+)
MVILLMFMVVVVCWDVLCGGMISLSIGGGRRGWNFKERTVRRQLPAVVLLWVVLKPTHPWHVWRRWSRSHLIVTRSARLRGRCFKRILDGNTSHFVQRQVSLPATCRLCQKGHYKWSSSLCSFCVNWGAGKEPKMHPDRATLLMVCHYIFPSITDRVQCAASGVHLCEDLLHEGKTVA